MSENKSEMVAVMLPRETAEDFSRRHNVRGTDARLQNQLTTACRRALRPEPPSADLLSCLESSGGNISATDAELTDLAAWGEYVLSHGWEPEAF